MTLYINKIKKYLSKNSITIDVAAKSMGLTTGGFHQAVRNNTFKVRDIEKLSQYLSVPFCTWFPGLNGDIDELYTKESVNDMIEREKFYQNLINQLTETNRMLVGKVSKLEQENESLKQTGT